MDESELQQRVPQIFEQLKRKFAPVIALKPHNHAMTKFKQWIIERDVRERDDVADLRSDGPLVFNTGRKVIDVIAEWSREYVAEKMSTQLPPGQASLENYLALMDSITSSARAEPGSIRELDGTPAEKALEHIKSM